MRVVLNGDWAGWPLEFGLADWLPNVAVEEVAESAGGRRVPWIVGASGR